MPLQDLLYVYSAAVARKARIYEDGAWLLLSHSRSTGQVLPFFLSFFQQTLSLEQCPTLCWALPSYLFFKLPAPFRQDSDYSTNPGYASDYFEGLTTAFLLGTSTLFGLDLGIAPDALEAVMAYRNRKPRTPLASFWTTLSYSTHKSEFYSPRHLNTVEPRVSNRI